MTPFFLGMTAAACFLLVTLLAIGTGGIYRRLGWTVGSMRGKKEPRPAALGIGLLIGFILPVTYHLFFMESTRGDIIYSLVSQKNLLIALSFSSLGLWAWGCRLDYGKGGLETILFLWAAQAAVWLVGVRIEALAFNLPWLGFFVLGDFSVVVSFLITLLWLSLVSSMVEWFDGLDGVAGLVVGLASLGVFIHSRFFQQGEYWVQTFSWTLMTVSFASAFWGRPGGKLLLGKNGVLLLGFWLSTLTILARQKKPTAEILTPLLIGGLIFFILMFGFVERSLGFSDIRKRNRSEK